LLSKECALRLATSQQRYPAGLSFFRGDDRLVQGERGEVTLKANPETLPDSADPSGPCPRCGRVSNFSYVASLPASFGGTHQLGDGSTERDALDRVSVLVCLGCHQPVVVVEERWVGDHPAREGIGRGGYESHRGIHWWPTPGATDLDEAIPQAIRDGYGEAVRALSARAPRAAAVMLRGTVEALVRDKGSEAAQTALKRRLADALRVMADEHALPEGLADWATEIRLAGNPAAHLDPLDEVDMPEAEALANLARQLLHYVYEQPAQLRRVRGT
jgi:Domain of unknown function (DUF4145)